MTETYECPARYWPAEVALILLNAAIEGEEADGGALIEEMTPREAHELLAPVLVLAAEAIKALDPKALELWRENSRALIAELPLPIH